MTTNSDNPTVLSRSEIWSVQRIVNSIADSEVRHGSETADRYGRLGETITHLMQAHGMSLRAVCRETETSTRLASWSTRAYDFARGNGQTVRDAFLDWSSDRNAKSESVTFTTFVSTVVLGKRDGGESRTDPLKDLDKAGKALAGKYGVATPKVVAASLSHLDGPTVRALLAELQAFVSKLDDAAQAA